MKIIHSIFSFHVGGAETMLIDIINQQCKEASISLIIVNDKVNINLLNTIDKSVNIYLIKRKESNKIQLFTTFFKINRIVKKINPDAIHCHDNKLFPFFIRWKRKTCITIHSINLSIAFLKYFSRIFAISDSVKNNIKERTGINAHIVFNGIEIEKYKSRENYSFDPKKDEFKIIQISRLSPKQKGQHIAIHAISLLKKQYPDINIKLFFIGGGEAIKELEELAVKLTISSQIVFLGTIDRSRIKNDICNYHVLIQPSLIEGFGITITEGFACGLPVIASNLDGPKEICHLLNAGLLVYPNDPVDLAEKILQVYQSYVSNTLKGSNYILKEKKQLKIFDIQTTATLYTKHYIL